MSDHDRGSVTPVAIVILAAGSSTRLGTPKQLLQFGEETLLSRAARAALSTTRSSTFVVIGAEAEMMRRALAGLPVNVVVNPDWREGLSSSVRHAVASLDPSIEAALFMTCDQPLVTSALLQTMIDMFEASGGPIIACEYADTVGVPALFARSLFSALQLLKGDAGAKALIMGSRDVVIRVPFPEGSFDIDTIQDLRPAKP